MGQTQIEVERKVHPYSKMPTNTHRENSRDLKKPLMETKTYSWKYDDSLNVKKEKLRNSSKLKVLENTWSLNAMHLDQIRDCPANTIK